MLQCMFQEKIHSALRKMHKVWMFNPIPTPPLFHDKERKVGKGDRKTSSTDRLTQFQQSGGFSIKKLYHMLSPQYQRVPWKSMILQPNLHPRFKFNLWLAAQGRFATVDRLLKFGIQVPQTCVFCGLYDELFEHLFFACPYVKELRSRLLVWLGYHRPICDWSSEVQWINKGAKRKSGNWAIVIFVFGMMVYLVWKDRNVIRFQGEIIFS